MGYINEMGVYVPNKIMMQRALDQSTALMDLGLIKPDGTYVGSPHVMLPRPTVPATRGLRLQDLRMRPPTEEEKADPNSYYNNCRIAPNDGWICPPGFKEQKALERRNKLIF